MEKRSGGRKIEGVGVSPRQLSAKLQEPTFWKSIELQPHNPQVNFNNQAPKPLSVTIAERTPTKEEFPDTPPENLVAASTVFTPTPGPVLLNNHYEWWRYEKRQTEKNASIAAALFSASISIA